MKYIFILMMTTIILFICGVGILNLYILIANQSPGFVVFIQYVILAIDGLFIYNLSRGLIHFLKVNGIGRQNCSCSIDSGIRHNLVIYLIIIEVVMFLFAGCGFIATQGDINKINNLVLVYLFCVILIPVMIWWLYSLPLLESQKHSEPN